MRCCAKWIFESLGSRPGGGGPGVHFVILVYLAKMLRPGAGCPFSYLDCFDLRFALSGPIQDLTSPYLASAPRLASPFSVLRTKARVSGCTVEKIMPFRAWAAALSSMPYLRLYYHRLGRSSGCGGWFSQTPWVEAEARGGFKGALAAPLAGHGQKSSGREPDPGRRRSQTAATPRRPGSHSREL